MDNVKRIKTGDSVIVTGRIPGYENADQGLAKKGIVMNIIETTDAEGQPVLGVDVHLQAPVPGINNRILRDAAAQGPWVFPPQYIEHDVKKVGRV